MFCSVLRFALVPVLFLGLLGGTSSRASEFPKVSGFSAYLFNSETGKLSDDMMERQDELGNVIVGPPFSSVSTLIVVHLALGSESISNGQLRLEVTARRHVGGNIGAKSRELLNHVSQLGPITKDGTTHVGFWLDGTGCDVLKMKATLILGSKRVSEQRELSFACYE